jgi:GGDEF domain-containing protein
VTSSCPPPEQATARLVPIVPAVLGTTLILLALGRLVGPPDRPTVGDPGLAVAGGSAGIALIIVSALWRRHRLRSGARHLLLATCVLVGAADTVAAVQATGQVDRAAELVLLATACGLLLLDLAWYLGGVGAVALAWVMLAVRGGPAVGYHLAGLAVSVLVAVAVRRARLASLASLASLAEAAGTAQTAQAFDARAMAADAQTTDAGLPIAAPVIDAATGLPDWRGLLLTGTRLLAIARRESEAFGATVVRIEGYRDLVEQHGPARADELVAHLGLALQQSVRTTDLTGRWGPDELAVVAHGQGASPEILRRRLIGMIGLDSPLAALGWSGRLRLGHALLEPWETGEVTDVLAAARRAVGAPITVHGTPGPAADRSRGPHEILDAPSATQSRASSTAPIMNGERSATRPD